MIFPDYTGLQLKIAQTNGKKKVFDPVRKKWIVVTPEEIVRQYLIAYLTTTLHYPLARIACEKKIIVGSINRRFDLVVYNGQHQPWLLAECKAPDVRLTEDTLFQLLSYQQVVKCNYWVLTNGPEILCADACNIANIKWMNSLPVYSV